MVHNLNLCYSGVVSFDKLEIDIKRINDQERGKIDAFVPILYCSISGYLLQLSAAAD
jgi:hypothetical protein